MNRKKYALFEPGGRQVRGFAYGKLVEVRYIDVVRTGIESPDREVFIELVAKVRFSEEELRERRVGYVDENGVGVHYDADEFLRRGGNVDDYREPEPLPEAAK